MNKKALNIVEQDVKSYVAKKVKRVMNETLSRNGIDHRCTKAINQLTEGINNSTSENGGYTHFAVSKTTGKIVNGWDYEGYEPSELRQFKKDYFADDLVDMGFNPKNVKILTLKGLQREGIDPDDDSNWSNGEEDMQESAIKSKIMSIVNEELGRIVKKQLKEDVEGEEEGQTESVDFYDFVDALENCGWSYSNFYDVTGRNGETGVRYEVNADSGESCPFEELVNKVKSIASDPNKVIASQGQSKSAPEIKRASIVILD